MAMRDNPRISKFLDALEGAGVMTRLNWSAASGNVMAHHVRFIGDGFTPATGTAIILDYGPNGYGFYPEAQTTTVEQDVFSVASTREHPLKVPKP